MHRMFGWFTVEPFRRTGIHGVTRADLGDFWSHMYGQCRNTRGNDGHSVLALQHNFWLDMWVTQTKNQTHEQGG